jgi:hypothetical protein
VYSEGSHMIAVVGILNGPRNVVPAIRANVEAFLGTHGDVGRRSSMKR